VQGVVRSVLKTYIGLRRLRPHKDVAEILLQHDNAPLHTSLYIQEAIRTVLPSPPYRPDLAASECHLFRAHKGAIHRTKFGSDDEVIAEVAVSTKFRLVQEEDRCSGWCETVEVDGDNV
jgi:hypothetical protein